MPKISIILPTYKPKVYIEACLESIAQQVFTEFELLIILNAYKEPYFDYIKSLVARFNIQDKTKLIYIEQAGVSNARNIGIDLALGEYIAFIDDDDAISSVYLEELFKCSSEDSVGVSNVKSLFVHKDKEEIKDNAYTTAFFKLHKQGFSKIYKSYRLLNGPWGKLYHRDIIQSMRFYNGVQLGEDALFNFMISKNYKSLSSSSPNAIYYYRQCDNNSWSQRPRTQFISILIKLLYKYITTYLSSPFKYSLILFFNRVMVTIKAFSKRIVIPNE